MHPLTPTTFMFSFITSINLLFGLSWHLSTDFQSCIGQFLGYKAFNKHLFSFFIEVLWFIEVSMERMQERLSSDEFWMKAILVDISRTVCHNCRVYRMFMEVKWGFWHFLAPISHIFESFSFSQCLATLYRDPLFFHCPWKIKEVWVCNVQEIFWECQ